MYKKIIWIVAFAFSFILSQSALADSACGQGLSSMVESLRLDDSQKAKIKPILDQLKTTMKDNWTQMKDLRAQMKQQANTPNADQSSLDSLVDKKVQLIGNMIKAKLAAKNQIMGILNDQQKAALQKMMLKVEEKMEAKFQGCHEDA